MHLATRGNCQAVLRLKIPQRSETVITLPDAWDLSPTEDLLTRLERIDLMADLSEKAIAQSAGIMVNYQYVVADIEKASGCGKASIGGLPTT